MTKHDDDVRPTHLALQVGIIIPKKRKYKKAKQLSEEALQIAVKRREAKARQKGKDMPI